LRCLPERSLAFLNLFIGRRGLVVRYDFSFCFRNAIPIGESRMSPLSRDLVMFALGCEGGSELWDGRRMEDGIHLRWGFLPDLGYPLGGFDLYRRPHVVLKPLIVGFDLPAGEIHPSPWSYSGLILKSDRPLATKRLGTVTGVSLDTGAWVRICFSKPAYSVRLRVEGSAQVSMTAYHGIMPVGQADISAGASREIEADCIDSVELGRAAGSIIHRIEYRPISNDTQLWEKLNQTGPISLPVTHDDYPVQHPHHPDDLAEAKSRVDSAVWSRYFEVPDGGKSPWRELNDELIKLVSKTPPLPMAARRERFRGASVPSASSDRGEPEIEICPLQQTLTASLDHNLARILGLYWIDKGAASGKRYDYMIVGHWGRYGRKTCSTATWVDFDGIPVGKSLGSTFTHRDLVFENYPARGFDVEEDASHWLGTKQLLRPRRLFGLDFAVTVYFPHPAIEVQVYVGTVLPGAELKAYSHAGTLIASAIAGDPREVLTVRGGDIDHVEIKGSELHLFGICYLTLKNKPEDRSWIVYGVSRGVPASPVAPSGMRVAPVPGMPIPRPDGTLTSPNCLAVRWDLPVEHGAIEPGRAVMYLIQRQFLGNGAAPQSIDPHRYSNISPSPVLVTRPGHWTIVDEGTVSAPSQWLVENGILCQKSDIQDPLVSAGDLAKRGTMALAGRLEWRNYALTVRMRSKEDRTIGAVFRYQDRNNYYRFSINRRVGPQEVRLRRQLVKCFVGNFRLLWEDTINLPAIISHKLKLVARGNQLSGLLNGTLMFNVTDGDLTHGRIGLYCWANPEARFHHVRVTPPFIDDQAFFEDDFTKPLVTPSPEGWPSYPVYSIDQGLPDGWYAYRVAGIDIYGRISKYSEPAVIQALDFTPPPPPILVGAKALQARPSGVTESIIDRMLTTREQDWLKEHPEGGIELRWAWPGELRRQAPDASEFRIYFQPGRVNTITGRITKLAPAGPAVSLLTTDQATAFPPNALANEWMRVGSNSFKVVGSSTGQNFTLTVDNLLNPEHTIMEQAPEWVLPSSEAFSITLGPGNPHHTNYRDPRRWQKRIHVERLGPLSTPTGRILRVDENTDGTATVFTDADFLDPEGHTEPGVLVSGTQLFHAEEHIKGESLAVTVRCIPNPDGTVQPVAGDPFIYYPGYQYAVILPGLPLTPSQAEPIVYGQIGISTSDDKQQGRDDPARSGSPWGNRPGNEGPVSPTHAIFAIMRKPPKKLPGPPDSRNVYAEPADYYGHSRYTLRWAPATEPTLKYQVYRAMDASLFARDRAARAYRSFDPNSPGPGFLSGDRWREVAEELNALDRNELDYPDLSNDAMQVLASLPENEAAFTLLTPNPIDLPETANQDPSDPAHMICYTDKLDGEATNRYFYRIALIDLAGNRSPLADSTPPIYLPDTVPPQTPRFLKVLGGEKKVTLEWQASPEPGMDRYLIYRTTDPAKAHDIRRMGEPVYVKPHSDTLQIVHLDEGLVGSTTYYYRLVAARKGQIGPEDTDKIELLSPPSAILAARAYDYAPPDPPTITTIEWVQLGEDNAVFPYTEPVPSGEIRSPAVHIVWSSPDPELTCLVQFRVAPGQGYLNASGWLPRGKYEYVHRNEFGHQAQEYRIVVLNRAGNKNTVYASAPLSAAPVR
jgi:hypothetical protein